MTAELVIVTNRPERAVRYVLGVDRLPAWCRVVSDPDAASRLPNGTRYIGVYYNREGHRSPVEWAMIERRKLGGVVGLLMSEIDGLAAWIERIHPDAAADLRITSMHLSEPTSSPSSRSEP